MSKYAVRPITNPKGRPEPKPWGVWRRMPIGGWSLPVWGRFATKAEAEAEAKRRNGAA